MTDGGLAYTHTTLFLCKCLGGRGWGGSQQGCFLGGGGGGEDAGC